MPLYRKIEREIVLQKAENAVITASYTIEAAGKSRDSVLPDGWHYFSTDEEAAAALKWPILVPEKGHAGYIEYLTSEAFQIHVKAFAKAHGYLPSIAIEA